MAVFRITGKNNLNTRFSRLIALRNVPEQILKKLDSKRRYKLQQARNEFKRWSEPPAFPDSRRPTSREDFELSEPRYRSVQRRSTISQWKSRFVSLCIWKLVVFLATAPVTRYE